MTLELGSLEAEERSAGSEYLSNLVIREQLLINEQ